MKKLILIYRKIRFYFSNRGLEAILKYDPLNILTDKKEGNNEKKQNRYYL